MTSLSTPTLHLHPRRELPTISVPPHAPHFVSLRPTTTNHVTNVSSSRIRSQPVGWGSQMNHAQVGDAFNDVDEEEVLVEDLRVPEHWMIPSKAKEESEWLRVTLHKWLDNEYCPEETNIEISKVASESFYNSLVGKDRDIGTILLKMAKDLESISYQESFHGAFSSANAAVDLVMQRIEHAS